MKHLIIILVLFILAGYAQAFDIEDTQTIPLKKTDNPDYKYKSPTGNYYKYDLTKPTDQIKYDLDVGAQIKDDIRKPTNPTVDVDQSIGYRGAGIRERKYGGDWNK